MTKIELDLEKINLLYRAGEIDEAKKQYQSFLESHPESAPAWHALGMIEIEQQNLTEGAYALRKAIAIDNHYPVYQLHLANVYKMQGLIKEAIAVLENTINQHCDYIPAYNNLGILYHREGQFQKAVTFYHQAIAQSPDYIDAYYNMGLALTQTNQLQEAAHAYQEILNRDPRHFAAHFQLARILMQQGLWEKALFIWIELEKNHPEHFETQINLATCYLKQGELEKARIHYLKALKLNGSDPQALFNLGHIYMQDNQITEAVHYFEETIKINPDDFAAYNNLGAIYIFRQQPELALKNFREALRLQPENTYVDHIIKILTQDANLVTSPPAYISSLFDYYADHYDPHLLNALHYQAPTILFNIFKQHCTNAEKLQILDLGCGTGLCGELFKPLADQLIGVDLSEQMLKQAANKNIYDNLIKDDLIHFLNNQQPGFDLIMAGDVLLYIGNLESIFQSVIKVLKPKGYLLFNTEISDQKDFMISSAGRFQHSRTYIDKLIKNNGLTMVHYEKAVTRTQNHEPLYTQVYLLRMP